MNTAIKRIDLVDVTVVNKINVMNDLLAEWKNGLVKNWLYLITWFGSMTSPTYTFDNEKSKVT